MSIVSSQHTLDTFESATLLYRNSTEIVLPLPTSSLVGLHSEKFYLANYSFENKVYTLLNTSVLKDIFFFFQPSLSHPS
jgi:hypothetical protein